MIFCIKNRVFKHKQLEIWEAAPTAHITASKGSSPGPCVQCVGRKNLSHRASANIIHLHSVDCPGSCKSSFKWCSLLELKKFPSTKRTIFALPNMLIYSEMCLIGHRWFSVKKVRTLSPEWAANCSTDNIAFCLRKFIRSNVYFRMKIWKPRAYLDPLVHPPWEGGVCIPGPSYVHILRKLLTRMLQRPKLSEVKTGEGVEGFGLPLYPFFHH